MTYPDHPFIKDADALTDAEIQSRISDLYTKLSSVYRMPNPNSYVIDQIQMAIATYQNAYQARQDSRRENDTDGFNEIIDIS